MRRFGRLLCCVGRFTCHLYLFYCLSFPVAAVDVLQLLPGAIIDSLTLFSRPGSGLGSGERLFAHDLRRFRKSLGLPFCGRPANG
jgi:hypothetical protein